MQKCSAYSLIDEVIVPVTQYIITLSNKEVRVNFSSKFPSKCSLLVLFVHVENFSNIYAAKPTGESFRATPEIFLIRLKLI